MSSFPKLGLMAALAAGVAMIVLGQRCLISLAVATLIFLGTGGVQYLKDVAKYLPRDLWLISRVLKSIRDMKNMKKNRVYISDLFRQTAKKYPNKVAIMFEDRQMTFRELDELSNRVANVLRNIGLKHRDTAAIFMENSFEFLPTFLALSKLGVTAAFINYNLRKEALAHCIKIANCSAVVFSPSLADALGEVLPELDPALSESCFSFGEQSTLPQARNMEEEIKTASASDPPPPEDKKTTDKVCLIYTSGTTGLPKACQIRHVRYFSMYLGITLCAEVRPDDVIYCTLPLYHTNGGVLCAGQMLSVGATLVIRKKFSASNFWLDCIKYKCTVTFYIGELCRYLLAQPDRPTDKQHSVRVCIGNGLRPQIWTHFTKRFGIEKIAEFYGSTESNGGMINPFNKPGACGFGLKILSVLNQQLLIKVHPETWEYVRDKNGFCIPAGMNEPGELVSKIRDDTQLSNYTDSTAASKKIMTDVFCKGDKYFLTGDILRMDEESFFYFCDRTGDTFRWKGENVSTTEVEATIANVLELRDAVVYGVEVPGSEGRAGMAAIVGTEASVDLANLAKKLFLSLPVYAVPLFVRLLPKVELTGTFKLKKVQLRNEGFDINKVHDPLYVMDQQQKTYVPITPDLYQQISTGNACL